MDPTQANKTSSLKSNSHPKPTKAELMSSAKLVADAAKAKLHHEPNTKVKNSELAGAAADLLYAASHYGKLEESGVGKFVEKAETYLHKYETSHSTTTTTTISTTTAHAQSSEHTGGKQEQSGSGYGEYIKMAEGVFKKYSGDSHTAETGGGSGGHGGKAEYLKMAGDFLKKH